MGYASGRVVFSRDDLAEVAPADGRFEVFAVQNACSFGFIVGSCSSARVVARTDYLDMALEEGEYFQMDGESFLLDAGCQVEVERNRQVKMLRPPTCRPGIWSGRMTPGFWGPSASR